MTLRLSLDEIRARLEGRREQKTARDAALRARGVTVLRPVDRVHPKTGLRLSRVLLWRRRED